MHQSKSFFEFQDLVRTFGATLIDGGENDIRVIGIVTLILILILAFVGMDWVTRVSLNKIN